VKDVKSEAGAEAPASIQNPSIMKWVSNHGFFTAGVLVIIIAIILNGNH
jgi:hypothetical protein